MKKPALSSQPSAISPTATGLRALLRDITPAPVNPYPALTLRCLIANDEARIRYLAGQLQGEDGVIDALDADDPQRAQLLTKFGDVARRIQRRRAALQSLSPAAPLPATTASEVASTPHAARPGTTLQTP